MPVGFAMMVQMAASNTLIQAMVPDALRGRVMARLLDDVHGHGAVRRAVRRLVAERIGAPATVAIGGVVCLAGAGVFALRLPTLRARRAS